MIIKTISINNCDTVNGIKGARVLNFSLQKDLPTSIAASILAYGVFLGDIIPHKATLGFAPKNGICPFLFKTPELCVKFHLPPAIHYQWQHGKRLVRGDQVVL